MQRHGHRILVYLSLLVAQGVVISIFERMLPSPFVFAPGAKLGLANIVTLLALFTLTPRQSFQVVSLRLLVTLLVGGTFSMFFYSLAGSYLSFGAMLLVKQLGPKRVSVIGLSILGGMLFNVGQLSVAAWFDSLQLSALAQSRGLSCRASGWGLGLLSLGKQPHLTILPAGQPEGDLVLAGRDLGPVLFCCLYNICILLK